MKYGLFLILFSSLLSAADYSFICDKLLQKTPELQEYKQLFTADFVALVPYQSFLDSYHELYLETGTCTKFSENKLSPTFVSIGLETQKNYTLQLALVIDSKTKQIAGIELLFLKDPNIAIQSWNELQINLAKIAKSKTLKYSAALVSDDGSIQHITPTPTPLAIGSAFKLYVLGNLINQIEQNKHRWDEPLALREDWKSLPSGNMHTLPAGTTFSLLHYAKKMISISDNTATDHLLSLLGRENVEAQTLAMGNSHAASYFPLLKTLEMFKLKWAIAPADTLKYIASPLEQRRQILDNLTGTPKETVGTNGVSMAIPTSIDTLEWFATPEENCKAMFWLAKKESKEIKEILSINTPLVQKDHWKFVGYKGGSEPGVLNLTFLLESKSGKRGCFAATWNDSKEPVDSARLLDIVQKTLQFAESLF